MSSIVVKQGQSLMDIAIVYTGDVNTCFQIASLNNLSITAQLEKGQILAVPEVVNKKIVELFPEKHQPATDLSDIEGTEVELEGVGYWIINKNFIVS